jgi:chromosomal replication initiation ATPase DnaA
VIQAVARFYGVEKKRLTGKRKGLRDERARAVAPELIYYNGGIGQVEIGRVIGGLDYAAVSRERKRRREKLEHDTKLRRAMAEIDTQRMSEVKI